MYYTTPCAGVDMFHCQLQDCFASLVMTDKVYMCFAKTNIIINLDIQFSLFKIRDLKIKQG